MLKWIDQLSLRAKITVGFALLIATTLAVGGVSLAFHWRALAAIQTLIKRDARVDELSVQSSDTMLKARRFEKEFLLQVKELQYEEAKARYVTLVRLHLATVRENMAAIRALTDNPDIVERTQAIERATNRYETEFVRVAELYGRLGRRDTGLVGAFSNRAQAIEAVVREGAPEHLMTGLLGLRRVEKDYVLSGLDQDAEQFNRNIDRYRENVGRAGLSTQRKEQLLRLTNEYQRLFREYVALDADIDSSTFAYLRAVHAVEPMLEQLHSAADAADDLSRAALQQQSLKTISVVSGATVGTMLLGLLALVVALSRNVNRSLRECVDFAGSLADGNLAARLRPGGSNEFGVLSTALNRMADALQGAHRRQEEQAVELHRLNRTLLVLSQCNEALVRATSEADLLQTICDHIVAIGGYRLAWVGYVQHDHAGSVSRAACAGEGSDYLDALQSTWADSEGGRSPIGTAIREGRPVIVHGDPGETMHERWHREAIKHGFASVIVLPLKNKEKIIGALKIGAVEPDAFDSEEVAVLQELADDLAYGIASLRETDERKRFERELEHQANFDALTGVANRFTLEARLGQALANARRRNNKVALLFIDLDRFKAINDTLGHAVGDQLLIEVARRLGGAVRESDTVARLGGDEFVVFLTDVESAPDAALVAGKMIAQLTEPMQLGQQEIRPGASVGISVFPEDGDDVETLMKNADTAMYHAKSIGGNAFRFYAPEMNLRMAARFAMEADLRRALERAELMVYFQPQMSLLSGMVCGAEALMRWRHPDKGMVSPAEFIPLAEQTGLIQPLGEWVIASVCAQVRAWLDAGLPVPTVAVNLSARQFRQENLVQVIRQALDDNALDAKFLELEITESAVMHDVEAAVATLGQLKALGVRLSLDDFGTGYSSLSYLKRFPVDHLKIDQSFVREITTDPDDAAICVAVIGLAHSLGLSVIAEGVETEGQMNYLRRRQCDEMQGYYFSRPLPGQEFAELLTSGRKLALPVTDDTQRTILIVDDDALILSALDRLLRRDGYRILTASSARVGLELLATNTVQVVLSDQRMPQMNGTEFLSKVKELYPDTIRIILSGYTELETVLDAINRGAIYRFFTKPWEDNLLRDNVREVFRHHWLIHGAAAGVAARRRAAADDGERATVAS